jgi:hypothetical protein
MSIKLVVKIIIASAMLTLYKIFKGTSYVMYNDLAVDQLQNGSESYIAMQMYKYILDHSWIVLTIIMLILFYKEVVKLIKLIREKLNESY